MNYLFAITFVISFYACEKKRKKKNYKNKCFAWECMYAMHMAKTIIF